MMMMCLVSRLIPCFFMTTTSDDDDDDDVFG